MFVVFGIISVCVSSCLSLWREWTRVCEREWTRATPTTARARTRRNWHARDNKITACNNCIDFRAMLHWQWYYFIYMLLLYLANSFLYRCIVQWRKEVEGVPGYLIFEKLSGRSSRITRQKQRCLSNVWQMVHVSREFFSAIIHMLSTQLKDLRTEGNHLCLQELRMETTSR